MKPFLLLVALACLTSGCAMHYDMVLSNGMIIRTDGKPKLTGDGYYVYRDLSGRENAVQASRVRQIEAKSKRDQEARKGTFRNSFEFR